MYLKSLTLKGFKSFADRAHMVFEPGLTVIVGPNGSGKSNVSDAIRWVLGEQSAKQLRGAAMEDVVFAGSSARKPVGMAEVDLTLDNSDHVLPVDFEEVVVTRRMYRSGESEYLINGAPARLLDITDILHDTGLGKETHSIIGQGKLDSILASKPEERRALIEEAAGISKHKRRRERSLKRLESMESHLQRVLDVQKEVSRQLKPLERQVDKAKRASEISERARELRCILAVDDLRRLQARWDEVQRAERERSSERDVTNAVVAQRTQELDNLRLLLEEKGIFAGDLSEQRRRAQLVCEKLEGSLRLLDEKGRSMAQRTSQLSSLVADDEARGKQILEECERARVDYDEAMAALKTLRERSSETKQAVDAARKVRRKAEEELDRARSNYRATQRDRDMCAVALAKAQDAVKNAEVQDGIFATRADQLDETITQLASQLSQATEKLDTCRTAIEGARREQESAAIAFKQAKEALGTAQAEAAEAQRALASAEARASAARETVMQAENSVPLAKRLCSDAAAKACAARTSEVLNVPGELEGLVERLLGDGLTGFVVEGAQGLVGLGQAAQRLAADSAGTIHIVEAAFEAPQPEEEGVPGYRLLDRVSTRPGFESVARAYLQDVWVVGSVEEACRAAALFPQLRFATPDGAVASRGGLLDVGKIGSNSQSLFERRRVLSELEEGLPRLREDLASARAAQEAAEAQLSQARDAQANASTQVARLTGEERSCTSEVARLEKACAASKAELEGVNKKREEAREKSKQAFTELTRQQERLNLLVKMLEDAESLRIQLEEAFDDARRSERLAHEDANSVQLELARVQERSNSLQRGNDRLEREGAELAQRITESRASLRTLKVTSQRVEPLRVQIAALLDAARAVGVTLNDRASLAEADSAQIKETIDAAKAAVTQAEEARTRATSALADIRVQKGRLEVQVDQAVKSITSQPGVVLEEALELPEPEDREADARELQRLERQLAEIGPVNQVAFDEYETLKARSDYLSAQVEDLQHARSDLRKILAAIDRKMRDGFLEAFDTVNKNFGEIFGLLFPGGQGHLEMTDPEDPSSTGIEVVAQPRGKRVTKMSLLSGGERSLTALGLLFAVYKTRSVPFYVLDEVEAALDDSNLDRLLGAIERLRTNTQLIVISHQRRTMEAADVLYGVSMKSDGVSQVISQKLERK